MMRASLIDGHRRRSTGLIEFISDSSIDAELPSIRFVKNEGPCQSSTGYIDFPSDSSIDAETQNESMLRQGKTFDWEAAPETPDPMSPVQSLQRTGKALLLSENERLFQSAMLLETYSKKANIDLHPDLVASISTLKTSIR
jgi:hypothetical protein